VGITDILNTARDAMAAQTFGLTVTGQNVANVNTPGYVRRQALLETRDMGDQAYGSVHVAGLQRVADRFVEQRHLALTGRQRRGRPPAISSLSQTEALFNDFEGTGLSGSLNALFSSFSALSASPSDLTTRATLLGRAQTFADQVRSSSDQMQNFRTDLFSQARELTGQINSKLDTVAQLSGRINQARAAGEEPADLEDKRDAELLELSQMVEIHTYTDGNGQLVVQGPGVTLVQSDQARHLSIDIDSDGSLRVLAETAGGNGSEITKFLNARAALRDPDRARPRRGRDAVGAGYLCVPRRQPDQQRARRGLWSGWRQRAQPVCAERHADGAAGSLRSVADVAGQPERLAASNSASQLPGNGSQATLLAQLGSTPIAALGDLDPGRPTRGWWVASASARRIARPRSRRARP
jgi:hypothetical protein